MILTTYLEATKVCVDARNISLTFLLALMPVVSSAEIIWSGDFSRGDFSQWHRSEGAPPTTPLTFFHMPEYGRPIQYGMQENSPNGVGNGDLCSLVSTDGRTVNGVGYPQGPTRGSSPYAVKLTVKSSAGGGVEPDDCDGAVCDRRRTALNMQATHSDFYNALPYQTTRWWSMSIFLPNDYDSTQNDWGGAGVDLKPRNEAGGPGNSGSFSIYAQGNSWWIRHTWSDQFPIPDLTQIPYWQRTQYTTDLVAEGHVPFPSATFAPDLLNDYPDVAASQSALGNLNKGGWTDWVVHMRADARTAAQGGSGFIDVWKRAGSGSWVHVLHLVPRIVDYGPTPYARGIGFDVRPSNGSNGGNGIKMQIYMPKDVVWNDAANKSAYFANVKVGDENATFADMSPDGSTPTASAPPTIKPKPPVFSALVQ